MFITSTIPFAYFKERRSVNLQFLRYSIRQHKNCQDAKRLGIKLSIKPIFSSNTVQQIMLFQVKRYV